MYRGPSASGKTRRAKEVVLKSWNGDTYSRPGKAFRLNKDDLRAMLHEGVFNKETERVVNEIQTLVARHLLNGGYDVIMDNTHVKPRYEQDFLELAKELKADFETWESWSADKGVSELIQRDKTRANPVGNRVIERQWMDLYPGAPLYPKPVKTVADEGLPKAVMLDIDNTVADHDGIRYHYDWDKVNLDKPILDVYHAAKAMAAASGAEIVFLSGRNESCRELTEEWIKNNLTGVGSTVELYMRPKEDTRKDCDVKSDLYFENVFPKYDVIAVLDDRDQVVKMWRSLGLRTYQVADGNF